MNEEPCLYEWICLGSYQSKIRDLADSPYREVTKLMWHRIFEENPELTPLLVVYGCERLVPSTENIELGFWRPL